MSDLKEWLQTGFGRYEPTPGSFERTRERACRRTVRRRVEAGIVAVIVAAAGLVLALHALGPARSPATVPSISPTPSLGRSVSAASPMCGGRLVTIVVTHEGETVVNTPGDDVILAPYGFHMVFRGGHDLICTREGQSFEDATKLGFGTSAPNATTDPSPLGISVSVFNATTTNSLASALAEHLSGVGYDIPLVSNRPLSDRTIVYYAEGVDPSEAQSLADQVLPGAPVEQLPPDASWARGDLAIVLGPDYVNSPLDRRYRVARSQ